MPMMTSTQGLWLAFLPALLVLAAYSLLRPAIERGSGAARTALLVPGIGFAGRYLVWRATESLPAFTGGAAAWYSYLVFVADLYLLATSFQFFWSLRSMRSRSGEGAIVGRGRAPHELPRVEVLIPDV